jgi:hypothetical protein
MQADWYVPLSLDEIVRHSSSPFPAISSNALAKTDGAGCEVLGSELAPNIF